MRKHEIVDEWSEKNMKGILIDFAMCSCGAILKNTDTTILHFVTQGEEE